MAISKIIYKSSAEATPEVWMDATMATAAAANIIAPYTAMLADGVMTTGTGSGGGGGLEYETGTWTPTEDIARGEIAFTDNHTTTPCFIAIYDASSCSTLETYSNNTELFFDPYRLNGDGIPYNSTNYRYGLVQYTYTGSSVSLSGQRTYFVYNSDSTSDSAASYPRYWAKPDRFYPYSDSTSRYWRTGRTYKWIAVWAPTT